MLRLQPGVIYGPVQSRRLGRSLGVNLLPSDHKLCSFDCIYCQYGRTDVKTLSPEAMCFRSADIILAAVAEALRAHPDIDTLTFSGNGEPTLHPDFPAIVSEVRRLREQHSPGVKMTLLSNATTAHMPKIREALALFDAPIMKLDAGDATTLARINAPAPEVELADIIEGLKGIPGLVTQSALIDGRVSNIRGAPFEAWLDALDAIRPERVQIYSTDRPAPDAGVARVPSETLQEIAALIEAQLGLSVQAYWAWG